MTPEGLKAELAETTDEAFLECLTITHPEIDTIRLVNDEDDLVRTAGTYISFPFSVKTHPRGDEMNAMAEIVADNVDQRIILALRGLGYGALVTYEVVMDSSPNALEQGPFEFEINVFTVIASSIALHFSFAIDFLNEGVPKDWFAPTNSGA